MSDLVGSSLEMPANDEGESCVELVFDRALSSQLEAYHASASAVFGPGGDMMQI